MIERVEALGDRIHGIAKRASDTCAEIVYRFGEKLGRQAPATLERLVWESGGWLSDDGRVRTSGGEYDPAQWLQSGIRKYSEKEGRIWEDQATRYRIAKSRMRRT